MKDDVRPYKQKGDTCAIACMMMALEYFKIISKANWYDERRLYRIYSSKYMSGTPFSALAFYMAKKGLKTKIFHEYEELFVNDKKAINQDDFKYAVEEYKEYLKYAKDNGTIVINGMDINIDTLKQELKADNLVILAGEINNTFHAILLIDYDDNSFIVYDPLYKAKQNRTFSEIENFINTSIGKWFISVGRKIK